MKITILNDILMKMCMLMYPPFFCNTLTSLKSTEDVRFLMVSELFFLFVLSIALQSLFLEENWRPLTYNSCLPSANLVPTSS